MNAELARQVASSILEGFNRHFAIFQAITRTAKHRFETADWEGESKARIERISFYDQRVDEAIENLKQSFALQPFDRTLWSEVKRWFMWLLYEHQQPELAESFFNSVFCRLYDRSYYNNRHIFVKPGTAFDYLDIDDPAYSTYYPDDKNLTRTFRDILLSFDLNRSWQNIDRDIELLTENFHVYLESEIKPTPHRQLEVLSSLFFRNKAAYIVGRAVIGLEDHPFIIPILITDERELYVDTIIADPNDIALIFSFTRAYFMVNTQVPAGLVTFLEKILPTRSRADIYTSIGFQKQGKTLFYRQFLHHLQHSSDKLIIAPGIKGMVMSVFTLPSYPYVFKVIKDHFAPPKNVDRRTVKQKYQMVKIHDRVGRMADTLEFSHVAFPIERFSEELLAELKQVIASSLTFEEGFVIIRHLYIERRMIPFNIYLEYADDDALERGVISYGNAIKEMIAANIFPGDMLLKNFGVTRHGRIVFYDYDEICHMTDINIRAIPKARSEIEELSAEPWYHIDENDFFPEQFEHFVVNYPQFRAKFLQHHSELLDPLYWKTIQDDIIRNKRHDVYPYRHSQRFCHRYPDRYHPSRPI